MVFLCTVYGDNMPKFGGRSQRNLASVDERLQRLFNEVIKHWDCSVICGLRTAEEQKSLYAKGRSEDGKIVTYADGVRRKSKHQDGVAVDVIPYPIDWSDIVGMREFGQFVKGVAVGMGIKIEWGGDWKFTDLPHFEVKL